MAHIKIEYTQFTKEVESIIEASKGNGIFYEDLLRCLDEKLKYNNLELTRALNDLLEKKVVVFSDIEIVTIANKKNSALSFCKMAHSSFAKG
jgi:hypothetical protein